MEDDAPSHHIYTHPSRVEHWRHLIEIVALIIAALWGFYVFIYQERIKPAGEPPNLDSHLDVHHENLIGNRELVRVSLAWRNQGSAAAQIDGYAINTYGLTFGDFGDKMRSVQYGALPTDGKHSHTDMQSRGMPVHRTLIQTLYVPYAPLGGNFHSRILPGTSTSASTELIIPRGRFAAVENEYIFCVRREDDTRATKVQATRLGDGRFNLASLYQGEARAQTYSSCTFDLSGMSGL